MEITSTRQGAKLKSHSVCVMITLGIALVLLFVFFLICFIVYIIQSTMYGYEM